MTQRLLRPALHVMQRLAVERDRFRILEVFNIFRLQLRPVYLDGQLVELAGEDENRPIIRMTGGMT